MFTHILYMRVLFMSHCNIIAFWQWL